MKSTKTLTPSSFAHRNTRARRPLAQVLAVVALSLGTAPVLCGEAEWREHIDLGAAAISAGDCMGSIRHFEATLNEAKRFGKNDPRLATTLNELAFLYDSQGRYSEAELLYQRSMAIREKAIGSEHRRRVRIYGVSGAKCG